MLGRAQKYLFYLIAFLISSQVGLHFWPEFSYVSGVRVDYLSPILYLLDILIVGWIMISIIIRYPHPRREREMDPWRKTNAILIGLMVLSILWNLFYANSLGAHILGVVKLAELGLFAFFIAKTFRSDWISGFVGALSLSALVSSILAIWQFVAKSSIGGLWYYFGERTFSLTTVGISTVNLDSHILRPYAAFAHPNILAFFLLLSIVFMIERLKFEKGLLRLLIVLATIASVVGLVLTFSRIAIILLITFFFFEIFLKLERKVRYFSLGLAQILIPAIFIFLFLNYSNFLFRGLDFRQELLQQAQTIFQQNPYFGIGLNNFFVWQNELIKTVSPVNFQPPHNIYVVALLSLGLFGFFGFVYLCYFAVRTLLKSIKESSGQNKSFYLSTLIVLIGIMITGMFDHFFVTLEQGQIILALTLGLAFCDISHPQRLKVRKSKRRK